MRFNEHKRWCVESSTSCEKEVHSLKISYKTLELTLSNILSCKLRILTRIKNFLKGICILFFFSFALLKTTGNVSLAR